MPNAQDVLDYLEWKEEDKMRERHECSRDVVYPPNWIISSPCSIAAKYFEEGKWWCHHHAPSKVKAKQEKEKAAWVSEWADMEKANAHRAAADEALELGRKIVAAQLVYLYEDDSAQGLKFEGGTEYEDIEDIQDMFRAIFEKEGRENDDE